MIDAPQTNSGESPRRRLKILRVIARLNVGGPARHVALLACGLRDKGFDTTLVYGEPDLIEGNLEDLLSPGCAAYVKLPELGRRLRPSNDVRAFLSLLRLTFDKQPDIVHTHTAKAGVLGRLAAAVYNATRRRSSRCVVVHTFHGHVLDGYFSARVNVAVRLAERALGLMSDYIVTIAPDQRDDVVVRFRIAPSSKVRMIRLGLDLESLLAVDDATPSLRDEIGLAPDAIVYGYVGRLVPVKDLPVLVRAFAEVSRRLPLARLVLAGEGPLRSQLEQLAYQLGIADCVSFLGWRRDLTVLYRTFDVAVLSSRNEGTPVSLIEAMAAGRPVVATRVGGVPDVVTHGETGILVPPSDPEALGEAMLGLATASPARLRLGSAARRMVASRYSAPRLVAEIDRLYRNGIERKQQKLAPPW